MPRASPACDGAVAGVDEVGRGPLAGPVVAAAVILPASGAPPGTRDSKRLSPARRVALAAAIRAGGARVGLGAASVSEIDTLNILAATMLAMRRAVAALPAAPALLLVDGRHDPRCGLAARTIVRGDASEPAIAAASIIAKVARDAIMTALARAHPGYGWAANMGYPTIEHLAALARLGPCAHHRRSFAPVALSLSRHSGGAIAPGA